jgi:DNA (cytosine-5)-methyltransferase 1
MGYHRAGFDVVGVDLEPQPHYPFEFVQDDALSYAIEHAHRYDAIHASPPCQWGTAYARRPGHVRPSENMIEDTRLILLHAYRPFVIEQPEHGRPHMRHPVTYCGSSFGLDVRRHRLFEASGFGIAAPTCNHAWQTPRFKQATNRANLRRTVEVGVWRIPLEVQQQAMGIDWMTREELSQAIPPAYTEHIGRQLLAHVQQKAA